MEVGWIHQMMALGHLSCVQICQDIFKFLWIFSDIGDPILKNLYFGWKTRFYAFNAWCLQVSSSCQDVQGKKLAILPFQD